MNDGLHERAGRRQVAGHDHARQQAGDRRRGPDMHPGMRGDGVGSPGFVDDVEPGVGTQQSIDDAQRLDDRKEWDQRDLQRVEGQA